MYSLYDFIKNLFYTLPIFYNIKSNLQQFNLIIYTKLTTSPKINSKCHYKLNSINTRYV